MSATTLFNRWLERLAEWSAARAKFEAVIYYNGPRTRWERASRNNHYQEHLGGLRIPLPDALGVLMREPNAEEVLGRRRFRNELIARIWVVAKLRGLDHDKIVGEVRQP